MNRKRVHRLYREEVWLYDAVARNGGAKLQGVRAPLGGPNERWSMDFMPTS